MIGILEESKQRCLQHFGLREIPQPIQKKDSHALWVSGIALVRKVSGIRNYVILKSDDGNKPKIIKDFGPSHVIVEIEEIYPVDMFDSRFSPKLTSEKQKALYLRLNGVDEDKIDALLSKDNKTTEQIAEDKMQVETLIKETAIKNAEIYLAEEQRCNNNYRPKTQKEILQDERKKTRRKNSRAKKKTDSSK